MSVMENKWMQSKKKILVKYLQANFAKPVLWGTEEQRRRGGNKRMSEQTCKRLRVRKQTQEEALHGSGPWGQVGCSTCPARARGMWAEVQRASDATEPGSSWMGASSRSSMRGFLMWDSGLVRGVTLFLLIRVPGPRFTSCGTTKMSRQTEERLGSSGLQQAGGWGGGWPRVCLCACSPPPRSGRWTPPYSHRPPGSASGPCGGDTSGTASHLEQHGKVHILENSKWQRLRFLKILQGGFRLSVKSINWTTEVNYDKLEQLVSAKHHFLKL